MKEEIEGYINSQTWEAWADSIKVLWDNTEIVFLVSLTLSIGAVVYTWMRYPCTEGSLMQSDENRLTPEGSENLTSNNSEQNQASDDAEEVNNLPPSCPFPVKSEIFTPKELTKDIERRMSLEDKQKEREAQSQQLAAIFKLMKEQEEKFGDTSLEEIQDQMKFYCG